MYYKKLTTRRIYSNMGLITQQTNYVQYLYVSVTRLII